MTVVRVRGIQRFKHRKTGLWYTYHRKTGKRLLSEFGTGEFFAELAALETEQKQRGIIPGSLGMIVSGYKTSSGWEGLAVSTKTSYARAFVVLDPLRDMPVAKIDRPFLVALREEKLFPRYGRWMANYVITVMSVVFEHAINRGWCKTNPAEGIKRIKRTKSQLSLNRPWSEAECKIVLQRAPKHLKIPVALAMCAGLRKGDILKLQRSALRDGTVSVITSKRGVQVHVPIHPILADAVLEAPSASSEFLALTSRGKPWTESGFNSTFGKFIDGLEKEGLVGRGLTLHGLRHTLGTRLREVTDDLDLIRRVLGHQSLAMAQHYSQSADTSRLASDAFDRLNFTGELSTQSQKVSTSEDGKM